MNAPNIACKIEAYAAVSPSEDPEKIRTAISNVILDASYEYKEGSIKAVSRDLNSLSKIRETIRKRKVNRVYRRQMRFNTDDDTTWFYLNKQAAFVDVIAICDEAEESPMGPIKVILHSKNIEKIADWLAPEFLE
ncbi:MAG TPA: RNA-binding domain-containing protein [Candidatus Nitrosotalea sp.]|nr:RNA-binding domain-containing protein [Candidatus Nitrosotalea sp.]